jgi:hypothetical protein
MEMVERQRRVGTREPAGGTPARLLVSDRESCPAAMDDSPDLLIAGSVASNAVRRWKIDAENVVLKMR